jgi:hypothetical protein
MYNKTRKCKPRADSDRISGQLKLNVIFKNSYFKDDKFDNDPIQSILKQY